MAHEHCTAQEHGTAHEQDTAHEHGSHGTAEHDTAHEHGTAEHGTYAPHGMARQEPTKPDVRPEIKRSGSATHREVHVCVCMHAGNHSAHIRTLGGRWVGYVGYGPHSGPSYWISSLILAVTAIQGQ